MLAVVGLVVVCCVYCCVWVYVFFVLLGRSLFFFFLLLRGLVSSFFLCSSAFRCLCFVAYGGPSFGGVLSIAVGLWVAFFCL